MKTLHGGELRFLLIVYENAPLSSGQLASLAKERLGWERSTAYTVLRRLSDAGFLQNDRGAVNTLVSRDALLQEELKARLLPLADGDTAHILDLLLSQETLSDKEARALKRIIDAHRVKK